MSNVYDNRQVEPTIACVDAKMLQRSLLRCRWSAASISAPQPSHVAPQLPVALKSGATVGMSMTEKQVERSLRQHAQELASRDTSGREALMCVPTPLSPSP
jgi:hypothetical protein